MFGSALRNFVFVTVSIFSHGVYAHPNPVHTWHTITTTNGDWQGIYSYFITTDFPYVPRCFKGTPDSSFQKKRPQNGRGRQGRGQGGEGGRRPPPPRRPF